MSFRGNQKEFYSDFFKILKNMMQMVDLIVGIAMCYRSGGQNGRMLMSKLMMDAGKGR